MIFTNNFDPVLLEIGPLEIRWYGLLFALGIVLNYFILRWIFKREGRPVEDLESLAVYLFLGLVIGARLGQILFYEPGYYFSNPLEMLKIWKGGLSSHGATLGLFFAYLIWTFVHKVKFWEYPDLLVVPIPLTAAMVRLGNFFNSEIIGKPTNGDYGVIFAKLNEGAPRHPVQLYEFALNILIFVVLIFVYKKYFKKLPRLFLMFLFIFIYFATRFIVEIWKVHEGTAEDSILSMGQILSILPIIIAVTYFVFFLPKQLRKKKP